MFVVVRQLMRRWQVQVQVQAAAGGGGGASIVQCLVLSPVGIVLWAVMIQE